MANRILDNGFIFFRRTLSDVYSRLNDPDFAEIYKRAFVTIGLQDTTRQTTNSDFDLAFGMDYKAELVDKCDNVLLDITNRVFMYQFVHQETGIINQYIEIIQIPESFYGIPVHLKLSHWAGGVPVSPLVIYSNPFHVDEDTTGTTVITYWDSGVRFGIDYAPATLGVKINRIRIRGAFTKFIDETETETYTQRGSDMQDGTVIEKFTNALVISRNYTVEYTDNHGLNAFAHFAGHGVKYLNDVRCTRITEETGDVLGSSNFFTGTRKANMRETEVYIDSFQIAPNLAISSLVPTGLYTLTTFPDIIRVRFNQNITIGTGTLTVYNEDGSIFATFTEADLINIGASQFDIDISALSWANGNYYVNFTSGLVTSIFGQTVEVSNDTDWTFSIGAGDWLGTDWNNEDWFTN